MLENGSYAFTVYTIDYALEGLRLKMIHIQTRCSIF